jgi:hypothetical protein
MNNIQGFAGSRADHRSLLSLSEVKLENVDKHGRIFAISGVGPCTITLPEGFLLVWSELGGPLLRIRLNGFLH